LPTGRLEQVERVFASRFRVFRFSFLACGYAIFRIRQVIIKEKVEINPVQPLQGENPIVIFPDSIYGGNGDRSFSNNPQSTIILPTGGTVTVRIISSEAAGDAKIDLLQNQPEQQTLTEYANHYLGFNWTSQFYPPGTDVEFGIYWYWNYYGTIYEGNEAGAIVTQLSENKYEIGFEAAGDDWDYNELIIQVTIEDFELLVDINPSEISTGETAVVTVKKQFYDGRVEDFPAGQLFEVGMMEGCAAGGLVSGTDTAAYFNGVTQPMLFVAADSLENDEETVLIGVGLIQQNTNAKMSSSSKKEIEIESSNNKNKAEEIKDEEGTITDVIIIGGTCFGEPLQSTKQGFGNKVVEDECGFENCGDSYDDIQIQLVRQYNNFEFAPGKFEEVCKLTDPKKPIGQSTTVSYERERKNQNGNWENSWNLSVCKNSNDKIEFRPVAIDISLPTPIYIDFVADVCNNIISNENLTLLNDTTELKDVIKVSNLKIAVHDICGHYCYPQQLTVNGYVLKEVVELHELLHMSQYLKILNKLKSDFLIKPLEGLNSTCQFYNTYTKNPEGAALDFENKIFQYVRKAQIEYCIESGVEYSVGGVIIVPANLKQEEKNEKFIQSNKFLQDLVDDYHKALSKARGTTYPTNCFTCP